MAKQVKIGGVIYTSDRAARPKRGKYAPRALTYEQQEAARAERKQAAYRELMRETKHRVAFDGESAECYSCGATGRWDASAEAFKGQIAEPCRRA